MASSNSSSSLATVEEDVRELNLPFGYRFSPLDTELVIHYLKNKILGQQLPADIITIVDLYSMSPHQLPLREFKYGMENEWYFFTTRPKYNLFTKDGYWNTIPIDLKIFDDGHEVVGFMQMMAFYRGKPPNGTKTNWIMHEYRVNRDIFTADELNDSIKEKISNFVLCRLILNREDDPAKSLRTEAGAEALENCKEHQTTRPEILKPSSDSSADSDNTAKNRERIGSHEKGESTILMSSV